MLERVVGEFLLDGSNLVDVPKGEYRFIGNELGGVLIDTQTKQAAQVWGKANIWLRDSSGNRVRKQTLSLDSSVEIIFLDSEGNSKSVGRIFYKRE